MFFFSSIAIEMSYLKPSEKGFFNFKAQTLKMNQHQLVFLTYYVM